MQPLSSLFPRHHLPLRGRAALPRRAVRSSPAASAPLWPVVCLRPSCQLSADTADALIDAVRTRLRAAAPPACAVVLDLSAASAVDGGGRAALRELHNVLARTRVCLRLVVPEAEARASLDGDGTARAIGPGAIHATIRAAVLAEYAALPGPALVTPDLRGFLSRPPEPLPLPATRSSARRAALPPPRSCSPGDVPGRAVGQALAIGGTWRLFA
jgi:STAS domain